MKRILSLLWIITQLPTHHSMDLLSSFWYGEEDHGVYVRNVDAPVKVRTGLEEVTEMTWGQAVLHQGSNPTWCKSCYSRCAQP